MKLDWMITFRSVTYAQRAQQTMHRLGLECMLRRTPRELSNRGCGYSLHIHTKDIQTAVELLREQDVPFVKVYAMGEGGQMEERQL